MIELRILGGLELSSTAGEARSGPLAQPKRLALLAYLTLNSARGWVSRETLMGVFWPESDTEHARAALRKTIHYLRQEMGRAVVQSQGNEYLRVPQEQVWCDAVAFEARITDTELEAALPLYRGELLPGLFVSECPEFEQWLELERGRMRSHALRAALRLSRSAAEEGSGDKALFWARRAELIAPQDEEVIREVMRLLIRLGDAGQARRAFDAFTERLRRQWEMEPSPETCELAQSLGRMRVVVPFQGIHGRVNSVVRAEDEECLETDSSPSASTLVYRSDTRGRFTYLNDAAARAVGHSRAELMGSISMRLIRSDYRDATTEFYLRQLDQRTPRTYFECPVVARDGREVWLAQKAQLLVRGGEVTGLRISARDVTVRHQAEQAGRANSHYDEHTGLYNRRACALLLEQKIRLALRNQRGFPLVRIALGEAPPAAAAAIAELLRDAFRASDILARLDPHTFLMLPDEWGPEESHVLLPRLEVGIASLRLRGLLPEELEVHLSEHRFDPTLPRSAEALLRTSSAARRLRSPSG